MATNPGSTSYILFDFGQVIKTPYASIFSICKMEIIIETSSELLK